MPTPDVDRDRVLRWLRIGTRLAQEVYGEKATASHAVWLLIVDAIDLLDKTPDQERRWLSSGTRSGGIQPIGLSTYEAELLEIIRINAAMHPADKKARYEPAPDDYDRMMGVLGWMRWCNKARNPQRLTKAAIALARGGDSEVVHRIYAPNRKRNRQTISEIKTRTIGYILAGLREAGIVVDGASFRKAP